VDLLSEKEVLARALLDLLVDSDLEKFDEDDIKRAYVGKQSESFNLSRLSDFRFADFLDASITASEMREESGWLGRLRHFCCMPWGVMRGSQFPSIHTSERCVIWRAQVEQVVRATGMTYAITVFAIPFVGPFMGKAFMYLNEIPAWLSIERDIKAGDYSYKQAPADNREWCKTGSRGVEPSLWLRLLWGCCLIKVGLLFWAVYYPRQIMNAIIVLFIMSLGSGFFANREKKTWKDRDALVGKLQAKTQTLTSNLGKHLEEGTQMFGQRLERGTQSFSKQLEEGTQRFREQWESTVGTMVSKFRGTTTVVVGEVVVTESKRGQRAQVEGRQVAIGSACSTGPEVLHPFSPDLESQTP